MSQVLCIECLGSIPATLVLFFKHFPIFFIFFAMLFFLTPNSKFGNLLCVGNVVVIPSLMCQTHCSHARKCEGEGRNAGQVYASDILKI